MITEARVGLTTCTQTTIEYREEQSMEGTLLKREPIRRRRFSGIWMGS